MQETKLKNGVLLLGDAAERLKDVPTESIDLVLTSPPYDDLRAYKGFTFDFYPIAKELTRVLKQGGVIVWVVADATVEGSETGTSFRQALYFKDECGLRLHDTMIFAKLSPVPGDHGPRYRGSFEYMFAFSKGKPKTFNAVPWKTKHQLHFGERFRIEKQGRKRLKTSEELSYRLDGAQLFGWNGLHPNIFFYQVEQHLGRNGDKRHPAVFPQQLAFDQINTWTNPGDTVLDPCLGSGSTARSAELLGRKYIGIEIAEDYMALAIIRIVDAEGKTPILDALENENILPIPLDFE